MEIILSILIACIVLAVISAFIITKQVDRDEAKRKNNRIWLRRMSAIYKRPESYKGRYQKRPFFSQNEFNEYQKLAAFAQANEMTVFAKVRLLDLLEPIPMQTFGRRYRTLLYKVHAKHVDFVVMNKHYQIIAIIELDDSSHFRPDRIRRDEFVDEILSDVGYKIVHTWSIGEHLLNWLASQQ